MKSDLTFYRWPHIIKKVANLDPNVRIAAYPEGGKSMTEVRIKENESLESALKRFKRSCAKAGVIAEVKKREHYVSPSLKRKQKSEAARKNKRKYY